MNKIISFICTVVFLLFTLDARSIDLEKCNKSKESNKILLEKCLDSFRVKEKYISILHNHFPYIGLTKEDLSEHDLFRIELLITGRYEEWELDYLAKEYLRKEIVYSKRGDSVYIEKIKNESFVDLELSRFRELIKNSQFYIDRHLVDMISYLELKQFSPIIVRYLKNNPGLSDYDLLELDMALLGEEFCISNAIRRYGYDKNKKEVVNPYYLFLIGTSEALYEIAKGLNSDKLYKLSIENFEFKDEDVPSPLKYLYLGYLVRGVKNSPFKECKYGAYISYYGEMPSQILSKDEFKKWFIENKDNLKVNLDDSLFNQLILMMPQ